MSFLPRPPDLPLGLLLALTLLCSSACGLSGPDGGPGFADESIQLGKLEGEGLSGQVLVVNTGPEPVLDARVRSESVPEGLSVTVIPAFFPVLDPDDRISAALRLGTFVLAPGEYSFDLVLLVAEEEVDRVAIEFSR